MRAELHHMWMFSLLRILGAWQVQGELQKEAREGKKAAEFLSGNPDPGRAYPCRTEFNLDKEARWRRAWCSDLEAQVRSQIAIERTATRRCLGH